MTFTLQYLDAPPHLTEASEKIAYKMSDGKGPVIIWCGGLNSDMDGSKATHLHTWAKEQGRAFIRFDYYGHGASSGLFGDGTISRWGADVVAVIDSLCDDDVILIGSSMGGWSSMLAARSRPDQVKALLMINPAPDFTEKLMWAQWPEKTKNNILSKGVHFEPSEYDEPYEYRRTLIEDGRAHQLLDEPFHFDGPVHIFQGGLDNVVPPDYSRQIVDVLTSQDVSCTLIKSGDHSLSRPEDLRAITIGLAGLCQKI